MRSDTNWNVLTRPEIYRALLQNRVPRVQVLLPLPVLSGGNVEISAFPLFLFLQKQVLSFICPLYYTNKVYASRFLSMQLATLSIARA